MADTNYPPETWDVLVGRVKDRWDRALIRIVSYSDVPNRFAKSAQICLVKGENREIFTIEVSNYKAGYFVCGIGLTSSEQADALIGSEVFVHRSMRPALPDGQLYPDEYIGMQIETEAGESLGEIEEVMETPRHEVFVTAQVLVPDVPEFVVTVDKEAGKVIVRDIAGLRPIE
ncbi:ribosome maturation factor RimM [Abditibacteriota bacterium]|nr:ribosome maturation factor RimM [Abditibacteriota bacterium]